MVRPCCRSIIEERQHVSERVIQGVPQALVKEEEAG
jgi:hypothetical protein